MHRRQLLKGLSAIIPSLCLYKGHDGNLEWKQETESLLVKLPDMPPCKNAYVLKCLMLLND